MVSSISHITFGFSYECLIPSIRKLESIMDEYIYSDYIEGLYIKVTKLTREKNIQLNEIINTHGDMGFIIHQKNTITNELLTIDDLYDILYEVYEDEIIDNKIEYTISAISDKIYKIISRSDKINSLIKNINKSIKDG